MYTSFFGLGEKPFAITPDPRYLFMSERHAEALAHLLYGVSEAGGFVQLTGEIGAGKTTLVRSLLERMPEHADVAVILNPQLSPTQLVLTICEELGIVVSDQQAANSIKLLVDLLNRRLLEAHARGRRVVVIIDEAQNLSPETLEQVRLLTNLETASQKLLQIILIGQPELRELLSRVELRQLAQRITGRYHLGPLSRDETADYVIHRLKVAGAPGGFFTRNALREVHRLSRGVPRVINVICDRALLGAYTQETHRIRADLVREAAGEVYGRTFSPPWTQAVAAASVAVVALGLGFGGWALLGSDSQGHTNTAQPAGVQAAADSAPPPRVQAAPVSLPDIETLLVKHADQTNTAMAFGQLFSLWGGSFDPAAGRPCDQAHRQGLECVFQQGSWAQLRTLNRPAILTLVDDAGSAHQVVISGLGDDRARIALPAGPRDVSIASVSRLWYGEYLVLWRPQISSARTLSAGMQSEGVRWLRRTLAAAQGAPSSQHTTSDYFDEDLARMVEDFQRRHRLRVDGVAGVQTQMVLDTLTNESGAPILTPLTSEG